MDSCFPRGMSPSNNQGGVGSWLFSEGLVVVALRVVGNALGWFNRATKTTRFTQWKDNKLVLFWSVIVDWALLNQTTIFFVLSNFFGLVFISPAFLLILIEVVSRRLTLVT
ncbi:hypothetical protein ACFE04_002309 [Oxalis oulophora]